MLNYIVYYYFWLPPWRYFDWFSFPSLHPTHLALPHPNYHFVIMYYHLSIIKLRLFLLNHGLLSSIATAAINDDNLCSNSCALHSVSTRDNLVSASSSSSSRKRFSVSTTLTLVLKTSPFAAPSLDVWPSSENKGPHLSHVPMRLWHWINWGYCHFTCWQSTQYKVNVGFCD